MPAKPLHLFFLFSSYPVKLGNWILGKQIRFQSTLIVMCEIHENYFFLVVFICYNKKRDNCIQISTRYIKITLVTKSYFITN